MWAGVTSRVPVDVTDDDEDEDDAEEYFLDEMYRMVAVTRPDMEPLRSQWLGLQVILGSSNAR